MNRLFVEAARKDQPLVEGCFTFYPLTMEHYETWLLCKSVLTLRLSTLPAAYASMPYLQALYAIDYDSIKQSGEPVGFMTRIAHLLCLSLHIPTEYATEMVRLKVEESDPRKLVGIIINDTEKTATVGVNYFRKLRELIAVQNGETLPDEAENPELIQAQATMAEQTATPLKESLSDLIASVAYQSGVRESEIYQWTIREFEQRRKAISRGLRYIICGVVEGSGASWKGGNPAPSWELDRQPDTTGGFRSESSLLQDLGKAVNVKS